MVEWGHPDSLVKADTPVLARIYYLVKYSDMWYFGDNPRAICNLIKIPLVGNLGNLEVIGVLRADCTD